jgi:enoyl-CoA hydratase/carnithine racemase
VVVPLLNGIDHMDLLRRHFGPEAVLPASIAIESERVRPGVVRQLSPFAVVRLSPGPRADDLRAELDAALARVINDCLQCAPGAVAATKALMNKARFAPPASLVQEASLMFARAALGPEGVEGTSAFVQKRKRKWAPQ